MTITIADGIEVIEKITLDREADIWCLLATLGREAYGGNKSHDDHNCEKVDDAHYEMLEAIRYIAKRRERGE